MAKKHKNDMHACMVRIYGRLVMFGRRTLDDIPEEFRDEVAQWVEENTY